MTDLEDEWTEVLRQGDDLVRRSEDLVQVARDQAPTKRCQNAPPPVAVTLQRKSSNRKIAPQNRVPAKDDRVRNEPCGPYATTTYVSMEATCPRYCQFWGGGCYADAGVRDLERLDEGAKGMSALEVSQLEARMIREAFPRGIPQDGARGGRDLRLHIAGDVSCAEGARALGEAADLWRRRGGGTVWLYTKRHSEIPRDAWGDALSVFGSCKTTDEAEDATERGYVPALALREFPRGKKAFWAAPEIKVVPCPAEATKGKVTCVECRLCLDRNLTELGVAIGFRVHGFGAKEAKKRLPILPSFPGPTP